MTRGASGRVMVGVGMINHIDPSNPSAITTNAALVLPADPANPITDEPVGDAECAAAWGTEGDPQES